MESYLKLMEYLKGGGAGRLSQTPGPDIPSLEKIPTNQFIEKFLEADDHPNFHRDSALTSMSKSSVKSGLNSKKNVDIIDDDLETVLDIKEPYIPYDDTGQRAYENACRKYRATASASFHRKLAESTHIDMRHYGAGPKGGKAIAIPLVINTKVTTLNLQNNDLSQEGIGHVARMLTENSYITELDLSDNNIRSNGAKLLAQVLRVNNYLTKLNLSGNKFNDEDAQTLAKPLEENHGLKTLILSNNEFSDRSGPAFRNFISENGSLAELDLSWNHIRMRGGIEIAKGTKENVGLKCLNVAWNGFGDDGAKEISQALKTSTLNTIDLTCNRIQTEGFLSIIKCLPDTTELKILKMGRNPIPNEAGLAALESLKNINEISLNQLDLGEIIFGKAFKDKLEEINEKHEDLDIIHGYTDSYGKRKLKQYNVVEEALTAMKTYCDQQGIGIVELFSRFDEDGSMSVTHDEFKQGLREARIPLSALQVEELIKALDEDGDGEIDFSELILGAQKIST